MAKINTKKTKNELLRTLKPQTVSLFGQSFLAQPKLFSTGSVGLYGTAKLVLLGDDGEQYTLQVGLNCTVIGSKEMVEGE